MIKLLIVNIAFRADYFYERWRDLKTQYNDIDITLIGPKYSVYKFAGAPIIFKPTTIEEERFRVYHIDMSQSRFERNGWLSWDLFKLTLKIKPHFIYLIGYENHNVAFQMGITKQLFLKKSKIVAFTMNGLDLPLNSLYYKLRLKLTSIIFDAMTCHYPKGREILLNQRKFRKPIYLQTQVGVNNKYFYKSSQLRNITREKYNLNDNQYIFGSVGRLTSIKGIFNVINALPERLNYKVLMIGDGSDKQKLEKLINEKKLDSKVILTGRVRHPDEVNSHLNALDCFLHVPTIEDTFPFSVVEAMAVGLPVIATNIGGMSYQLGKEGIIVSVGNIEELKNVLNYVLDNQSVLKRKGKILKDRVLKTFEIHHLNKSFNIILREILAGTFSEENIDQTNFQYLYEKN